MAVTSLFLAFFVPRRVGSDAHIQENLSNVQAPKGNIQQATYIILCSVQQSELPYLF
jgi:hypothetical protein